MRDEYQEMASLIRIALRVRGLHQVTESDALIADVLLERIPMDERRIRFLEKTLGPLLAHANAPLLINELTAWLGGATQEASAKRLAVSKSTLRRNREKIRELTGLDVDVPDERFRLELALRLGRFMPECSKVEQSRPLTLRRADLKVATTKPRWSMEGICLPSGMVP